jgi:ADP-ribose pyrophosphatase YjhB (NUDIX family)
MFAKACADATTRIGLGVGVIVEDEHGKILMEKRSDCGWWGLPGGRVEVGESIRAAAERELREEAGLQIRVTRLLGIYSGPEERIITYPDNGDVIHKIDAVVVARVVSGTIVLSHESERMEFRARGEIPGPIVPPARKPLRDYFEGASAVID